MRALVNHIFSVIFLLLLAFCDNEDCRNNIIKFATSADYPPFAFFKDGKIQGFEIDLSNLIAEELGQKAEFSDMQFSSIPVAVTNKQVDAGIAAMSYSAERAKNFAFSDKYSSPDEGFAILVLKKDIDSKKFFDTSDITLFSGKKIACQLGSIMEVWLKEKLNLSNKKFRIISYDYVTQIIEALKSKSADFGVIECRQAKILITKNPELIYRAIESGDDGYRILLNKDSILLGPINAAIHKLKKNGKILELQRKWF